VSLAFRLKWVEILGLLGEPPEQVSLPVTVNCPLCHHAGLRVDHDVTYDSQWLDCSRCGFMGDPIDLARAAWDLSYVDTVHKLASHGIDLPPEALAEEHLKRVETRYSAFRAKIREFVRKAGDTLLSGEAAEIRHLRKLMGFIDLGRQFDEWRRRGGQFVGAASLDELGDLFYLEGEVLEDHEKRHLRLPHGRWDHALVLPAWDKPGRVSGLLLVGGEGAFPRDYFFRPALYRKRREMDLPRYETRERKLEAGLFMRPALEAGRDPEFDDLAVVMDRPDDACRLHLRHFMDHARPLPLAATWEGPAYHTRLALQSLSSRPLVYWPESINQAVVAQARETGGRIFIPDAAGRASLLRELPINIIRKVAAGAVDWRGAIAVAVGRLSQADTGKLLTELHLPIEELSRVRAAGTDEARARIDAWVAGQVPRKTIRMSRKDTITQTPEGWWVGDGQVPHTQAILRIDQVLVGRLSSRVFYRGRVTSHGVNYPFCLPSDDLETNPRLQIRKVVLDGGGEIPYFTKTEPIDIVAAALLFSNPQTIQIPEMTGWDDAARELVLPNFHIDRHGEHAAAVVPMADYVRDPAGANLAPPRPLTGAEVEQLSGGSPTLTLLWGTFIAVASAVVADILGERPIKVALVGDAARRAGAAAALALGCRKHEIQATGAFQMIAQRLLGDVGEHRWPTYVVTRTSHRRDVAQLPETIVTDSHCIAASDSVGAACAALFDAWGILEYDAEAGRPPRGQQLAALSAALMNYLQDVIARQVSLPAGTSLPARVQEDAIAWFRRQGGNAAAIRAVSKAALWPEDSPSPWAFGLFATTALVGERLYTFTNKVKTKGAKGTETSLEDLVFIPHRVIEGVLSARQFRQLDATEIEKLITAAGLPIRHMTRFESPGWAVPREWFLGAEAAHKARQCESARLTETLK